MRLPFSDVVNMNRPAFAGAFIAAFAAFLTAAGGLAARAESADAEEASYVPETEEIHITVPGMEDTATILWVSDLHIVSGPDDPDVTEEYREDVRERYEMMKSPSGTPGADTWEKLSARLDSYGADYVVFGADMIDYCSEENLNLLKEGIDRLKTPWMYLRADHDYGRWYSDMGKRRMRSLHRALAPQNKLWIRRFPSFTLAGLDNTTSAVSRETLGEFRALLAEEIPVILCTHVPFDSGQADSDSLAGMSKELWDGRVLCWGDHDQYDTSGGGCMKELLNLITAPGSPVCAVLAGHLHASWDGMLTDTCTEHVFSAAFNDIIGVITVSGEAVAQETAMGYNADGIFN